MTIIKHYTSVSQSKKLLELGLDPKTADMAYLKYADSNNLTPRFEGGLPMVLGDIPIDEVDCDTLACWSLCALLDILPGVIYNKCRMYGWDIYPIPIDKNYRLAYIEFGNVNDPNYIEIVFYEVKDKTLIETVYSMVIWLLENGYIKKESNTSSK